MASERKVTVAELLGLAQGPATAEPPSPSRLWDEDVKAKRAALAGAEPDWDEV
jgi:hypothetical protein